MKSIIPARHLLRHFLLFALTALFLLTVIRAAYGLWQFPKIMEANAVLPLFVQGLRFDLALIGIISVVPVVLGSLFSVSKYTRGFAKFLVLIFFTLGLLLILVLELITPWFIQNEGMRPDINLIAGVESPMAEIAAAFSAYTVPLIIGIVVCALIFIAFCLRMEINRFLRFRVFAPTGIMLGLVGGLLCLMAIWSTFDLSQQALSPGDSLISRDVMVNDLAMNSMYKTIYSLVLPIFNKSEPE
ncbi:MAG: hypothetical protein AB8B84_07105 [Granulosicoccus sp.]